MLDEIINYVQSLQRQVEVNSNIIIQCDSSLHILVVFLSAEILASVSVPLYEVSPCESKARFQHGSTPLKGCKLERLEQCISSYNYRYEFSLKSGFLCKFRYSNCVGLCHRQYIHWTRWQHLYFHMVTSLNRDPHRLPSLMGWKLEVHQMQHYVQVWALSSLPVKDMPIFLLRFEHYSHPSIQLISHIRNKKRHLWKQS